MALYAYRHVVANERTCYWLIHRLRWPNGVCCLRCKADGIWRMDDRGRCDYRCKACRYHFSLLTGTALQGTRLPLTKWVLAVALFKVGISSHVLARELQVSQRIAWRLLTRFRQVLRQNSLLRKLRGAVEVDDTYIWGPPQGEQGARGNPQDRGPRPADPLKRCISLAITRKREGSWENAPGTSSRRSLLSSKCSCTAKNSF